MNKREKGQFYTTNCEYILDGFSIPKNVSRIIEPFAGKGDILNWIKNQNKIYEIEAYDIDPKMDKITQRDTLTNPPNYSGSYVITNPPYLARNKTKNKSIYDIYSTNDLYKCFILSIERQDCIGGIFIIPSGFFCSSREIDNHCRNIFMRKYTIEKIKYFEEAVFDDTTTTIIAFSFIRAMSENTEQTIEWTFMPTGEQKIFNVKAIYNWIIGGDIYYLPITIQIYFRRFVIGQKLKKGEQQTFMTLCALDSGGNSTKRISLTYKKNYVYQAKESSRTYLTLIIGGFNRTLTEQEQIDLCSKFNEFLIEKRNKTKSLFLPQFREYARKRIQFSLVYRILIYIIEKFY